MDKSIIQFGYCPVQDTTYFVNIGYKLKEINYYVKVKSECSYVSYYHNAWLNRSSAAALSFEFK